jgi:hypothetical protein
MFSNPRELIYVVYLLIYDLTYSFGKLRTVYPIVNNLCYCQFTLIRFSAGFIVDISSHA